MEKYANASILYYGKSLDSIDSISQSLMRKQNSPRVQITRMKGRFIEVGTGLGAQREDSKALRD